MGKDTTYFGKRIEKLDIGLFDKIDSQTSQHDRYSLLTLQKGVRDEKSSYTYLEIGSHLGGSIQPYYLDDKCTTIYSIDKRPKMQSDERGKEFNYDNNSTERMISNLVTHFPNQNINKVITFDASVVEVDRNQIRSKPDICFVDAEHTNKAVFKDFLFCLEVSSSDAIIAFHDSNLIAPALQEIEIYLEKENILFASFALRGSVFAILLGNAIDRFSELLSERAKDKEKYFKRAIISVRKYRLKQRFPFLFMLLSATKKATRKLMFKSGLKKKKPPSMETREGHLGGYILGKAAEGTWCPEIWDWSIRELGVQSLLDVGCGLGYCIEYFDKAGVEAFGVDGSPSAIKHSLMPKNVHQHDYTTGKWMPSKRYDLVWSSEFLEHVEQQYEPNFFETFKVASKYLMVTFAIPGQGGHHHVNEQYGEYWINKIENIGFRYDEALTKEARNKLPKTGLTGMQFRGKGLVFVRIGYENRID